VENCQNKLTVADVPKCVNELIIGAIKDINTEVEVALFNEANQRMSFIQATSGPDGVVKIDLTADDIDFSFQESFYKLIIWTPSFKSYFISVENEQSQEIYFNVVDCNEVVPTYTLKLK
jgi:hypothetical protein